MAELERSAPIVLVVFNKVVAYDPTPLDMNRVVELQPMSRMDALAKVFAEEARVRSMGLQCYRNVLMDAYVQGFCAVIVRLAESDEPELQRAAGWLQEKYTGLLQP